MRLAIIAAISENGVIGVGNQLPWHLSEDLKYFKRHTLGKPIIMGRNTFESIGRPLPGRTNIVLSTRSDWAPQGVAVVRSLDEALSVAEQSLAGLPVAGLDTPEVMVIGGEQIYRLALPRCTRLYLTRVALVVDGDAFFPDLESEQWIEIQRIPGQSSPAQPDFTFLIMDRITS